MFSDGANRCPFCGAEIRRSVWDKCVLPAWAGIEDANRDLEQEYTGYPDTALSQIEYQTRKPINAKKPHFFEEHNPYKDCPNLD